MKEEAHSSALDQPYDQNQAKADKAHIRSILDLFRTHLTKKQFSQQQLAVLCIKAIVKADNKDSWISSFRKVNCHPRFREPFLVHRLKIDQDLKTGEQFFKDRDSLYDAMPAVWKNMTEENRRASFEAIKSFYADSNEGDGGVWMK